MYEKVYAVISRYNSNISNGLSEDDYNKFYYTTRIFHELNHSICIFNSFFDRNNQIQKKKEETFCDELSLAIIKLLFEDDFYDEIINIYNKFHYEGDEFEKDNDGYINFNKYEIRTIQKIFKEVGINIKPNIKEHNIKYNGNVKQIVELYSNLLNEMGIAMTPTIVVICDMHDLLKKEEIISRYENMKHSTYFLLVNDGKLVPIEEIEVF